MNPQIQEVEQTPSTSKIKKTTPKHIIIELIKSSDKENLKSDQIIVPSNKDIMYRETKRQV